jgi:AbrB family looped-hinge helix DNA binding protein
MPKSSWIQGAELIPENNPYKVDAAGRIVIPSHLRSKFSIAVGDEMEYYTTFIDDKWFMCVTKKMPEEEIESED